MAQTKLTDQWRIGGRDPALTKDLVQLRVADHLEERLPLAAAGADAEHRPRALVHEHDALVAIHGNHALHHAVEDGAGLGALLLEVADLLPQTRRHDVQGASERAELV